VPRLHPASRARPRTGERRRRCNRARPPTRLLRFAPARHPAEPHGARGLALRPRHDVRRCRPGHSNHHRAGVSMGAATENSPLLIETRDTHVLATLNRPEKRNAIDQDLIDALHELCETLEAEPRTLILRG